MIDTKAFEIYSYTEKERKTFSYIDRYMETVEKALRVNTGEFNDVGFALAGLFLTYRACNHSGCVMTTRAGDIQFQNDSQHFKRLASIHELTGIEFENAQQYLKIARVTKLSLLLPRRQRLLLRIARMRIHERRTR